MPGWDVRRGRGVQSLGDSRDSIRNGPRRHALYQHTHLSASPKVQQTHPKCGMPSLTYDLRKLPSLYLECYLVMPFCLDKFGTVVKPVTLSTPFSTERDWGVQNPCPVCVMPIGIEPPTSRPGLSVWFGKKQHTPTNSTRWIIYASALWFHRLPWPQNGHIYLHFFNFILSLLGWLMHWNADGWFDIIFYNPQTLTDNHVQF